MSDRLTLLRPDDWHIHLRDGAVLPHTVGDVARTFARAIIMPNLVPPVRNAVEAGAYRERILAARPAGSRFEPLMVLYLTDRTSPEDIRAAKASGIVYAAKLYPAGATTNSDSGVTSIDNIFPAIEALAETGLPLLVHGEVTRSEIDVFDREKRFIDEHMRRLVERFPTLKVVFEHITTPMPRSSSPRHRPMSARPSPPSTCCTTATTCWSAASAHTSIACRSSSATPTRWRCWMRPPAVTRSSSLGPTRRPTPVTPRKPPAAVPAATPPMRPSRCTPKRSSSAMRWTSWKLRQPARPCFLRPAGEHRHHYPGSRGMDRAGQPAIWRADGSPIARR